MPIYEYQCQACGHQFETTQRITESPLKDCPSCSKPQLERLISATGFVLKGSGWYKDGYGGSSNTKRTENQVGDRLNKALNDDKKKTEAAASEAAAPAATASATPASTPTSGGGSSAGSGGSSGGSSSGGSSAT